MVFDHFLLLGKFFLCRYCYQMQEQIQEQKQSHQVISTNICYFWMLYIFIQVLWQSIFFLHLMLPACHQAGEIAKIITTTQADSSIEPTGSH